MQQADRASGLGDGGGFPPEDPDGRMFLDLLRRRDVSAVFEAIVDAVDRVRQMGWVVKMFFRRTWEGWLYSATVPDCRTKQVVGCAMADHLRTSLITDALEIASQRITLCPGITIFHSDRGCQYTSQEFAEFSTELGLRRLLGRSGTCYELPGPMHSRHPQE